MKQPSVKSIVVLIVVLTLFFLLLARGLLDSLERVRAAPLAPLAFTVNDTSDLVDDFAGNGICHTASGTCTLRAAIIEANQIITPTTINLPMGTYTLTIVGAGENNSATGDLDVLTKISIVGALSTTTIIKGASGWNDRIFDNRIGAQLQISGVTIRNGNPSSTSGGGIYNAGILTLTDSALISNTAGTGYGGGIYSAGPLSLISTTLMSNTAGWGGGIYAGLNATTTLSHSYVYSNTATNFYGGGISNDGVLTINSSTLIGNFAFEAGGLYSGSDGKVAVTNSSIVSNTSNFETAIGNYGSLMTITNSSISYNKGGGGTIYSALSSSNVLLTGTVVGYNVATESSGAGIENGNGIMTLTNSTIVGNLAEFNQGGGIYNGSSLVIGNSTIISNSAQGAGGGIVNNGILTLTNSTVSGNASDSFGGGLSNSRASSLYNVTIANNTADNDNDGVGEGGGIYIYNSGIVTFTNTLIGTNIDKSSYAPDCTIGTGSLNSLGYNLVQSTTNCIISGTLTDIITGTNPLLGPLRNNGGETQTQAISAASPALDAGNPAGCRDANSNLVTTDQRGFKRPSGARCDIGAYEYQFLQLFLPFITRQ